MLNESSFFRRKKNSFVSSLFILIVKVNGTCLVSKLVCLNRLRELKLELDPILIWELAILFCKGDPIFLVAQLVKNLPAVWETWIQSLGWEDLWRRERLPAPVLWPGEFCFSWPRRESDKTE